MGIFLNENVDADSWHLLYVNECLQKSKHFA